jgi:hypothetical protein
LLLAEGKPFSRRDKRDRDDASGKCGMPKAGHENRDISTPGAGA